MESATFKALATLLLIPVLVGCGSNNVAAPKPQKTINIPSSCAQSKVLNAVQSEVAGAKFIDTKWRPAAGTELFDILNSGGISCSYGVQSAEIGATVRWVNDSKMNYEKWSSSWTGQGYVKVDLSEYGLKDGYFLVKPQSETQEFHIWNLNLKYGDIWVSISRTSGNDLEAGKNLIQAVLAQ